MACPHKSKYTEPLPSWPSSPGAGGLVASTRANSWMPASTLVPMSCTDDQVGEEEATPFSGRGVRGLPRCQLCLSNRPACLLPTAVTRLQRAGADAPHFVARRVVGGAVENEGDVDACSRAKSRNGRIPQGEPGRVGSEGRRGRGCHTHPARNPPLRQLPHPPGARPCSSAAPHLAASRSGGKRTCGSRCRLGSGLHHEGHPGEG